MTTSHTLSGVETRALIAKLAIGLSAAISTAKYASLSTFHMELGELTDVMAITYMGLGAAEFFMLFIAGGAWWIWLVSLRNSVAERTFVQLSFTSAWSVFAYLIPFVNLVVPYQHMREMWDVQERDYTPGAPKLLIAWWFMWILSNFLSNGAGIVLLGCTGLNGIAGALFMAALMLTPGILAIALIHTMTARLHAMGNRDVYSDVF